MNKLPSILIAIVPLAIFPAAAAGTPQAVPAGELSFSPELGFYAEAFRVPAEIQAALAAAEIGETVVLDGFPTAPGERGHLELTRVSIYSPAARVIAITGGAERRLALSPRHHFLGSAGPGARAGLSLDPSSGVLRGLVAGPAGTFELAAPSAGDRERHRLRSSRATAAGTGLRLEADCRSDHLPTPATVLERLAAALDSPAGGAPRLRGGAARQAVVAVDTDNELNHLKFSNDTVAATDWIADLFLEMNVLYERDLGLTLLQGDTFLRLDADVPPTYDDDPWENTDTPASQAQLAEFGSYWSANQSGVERVFAMLLSGKSSSNSSASGIAWIDGYCETQSTGGGYSINQVFKADVPVDNDARLVGHELGHNAGSPHTHCFDPPLDECSSLGNGCYGGENGFNCPPGGRGTVMSYCHLSQSNCGPNLLEFHPVVAELISSFIDDHHPGCIEDVLAEDEIFSDGFESGDASAWSEQLP